MICEVDLAGIWEYSFGVAFKFLGLFRALSSSAPSNGSKET